MATSVLPSLLSGVLGSTSGSTLLTTQNLWRGSQFVNAMGVGGSAMSEAQAFEAEAELNDALARMEAERQARIGRATSGSARAAYGAANVSGVSVDAVMASNAQATARNIDVATLPFRQKAANARANRKSAIASGVLGVGTTALGAGFQSKQLFPPSAAKSTSTGKT